jgi:hypothetical protein
VTDDETKTYSLILLRLVLNTYNNLYFTNTNGCTNSANDVVEVFALPTVTLTAPLIYVLMLVFNLV